MVAKSKSMPTAQQGMIPSYASSIDLTAVPSIAPDMYVTQGTSHLPPHHHHHHHQHVAPSYLTGLSEVGGQKVSLAKISHGGVPVGTTHIVTDKGGHTIYDSEIKLLLDSKKTASQGKKFIEDFTTYKHGSFLLFSQRGLLETLPLAYSCISVTGNATVIEPSIHTLPHVPDHQTSQTQVTMISKSSGYKYPTVDSNRQRSQFSFQGGMSGSSTSSGSAHPIPQVLTDISTAPKELIMQVESLKSGVVYSAVLKFPHPVSLTDISIPATGSMSSVSVDVWLRQGEEGACVRVAQSSEIKTRSLMLGNLTPPPVCQYVKVCMYVCMYVCTLEVGGTCITCIYIRTYMLAMDM